MLGIEDFQHLVKNAPLFAIDLVVVNEHQQILVGQRENAPAKGYWFVPGGRVFKDEPQENAVKRISQSEIGYEIQRGDLKLLGIYEHFYDDSFFDSKTTTHYINATHAIKLKSEKLNLPEEQHSQYQWLSLEKLKHNKHVHQYSKIFLPKLEQWLQHD